VFTFTALIYDGYKQQLVSGNYENKTQFDAFLAQRFGVYVSMWWTQELTAHVAHGLEQASLSSHASDIPKSHQS